MSVLSRDMVDFEIRGERACGCQHAFSDRRGTEEAIRDTALQQRVKAFELQGQLAALREEYISRFGSAP
jgi:hypothetical protein